MVAHHDGAIEMVSELSKFRGAAYDPVMNEFVSDLVNDQAVEIERMNILLTEISARSPSRTIEPVSCRRSNLKS